MTRPVPTVAELAARGLAVPVAFTGKGDATHWRISAEGQEEIYAAMRLNAEAERGQQARISSRPDPLGILP